MPNFTKTIMVFTTSDLMVPFHLWVFAIIMINFITNSFFNCRSSDL